MNRELWLGNQAKAEIEKELRTCKTCIYFCDRSDENPPLPAWCGNHKSNDYGLTVEDDETCEDCQTEEEVRPHVVVSECEGCGKTIFEDDPYFVYTLDDIYLCKDCAPEEV